MDRILALFVTFLPRRYWRGAHGVGILISGLLQLGIAGGALVSNYSRFASSVSDTVAEVTIDAAEQDPGTGGKIQAGHAMALGALTPIGFVMTSKSGRLLLYLVISALVRLLGYATDHPWGDPLLTFVDDIFHDGLRSIGRTGRSALRTVQAWRRRASSENDS